MTPQCFDEILASGLYGVIYKYNDTILFETRVHMDERVFIMRFNAAWIPEKQYKWFCSVCGRQFFEQMMCMHQYTETKKTNEIKKALGL